MAVTATRAVNPIATKPPKDSGGNNERYGEGEGSKAVIPVDKHDWFSVLMNK